MDSEGWEKTKKGRVVYNRQKHMFDILRVRKIFVKDRRHWDSGYYDKDNLDVNLSIIYQQILDYWEEYPPEYYVKPGTEIIERVSKKAIKIPPKDLVSKQAKEVIKAVNSDLPPAEQVSMMERIDNEIQNISKDMLGDIFDLIPFVPDSASRSIADAVYDGIHNALESFINKLF